MTLQFNKQLNLHDPDNGIYGDCFRTCIANLFQLKPDQVPHFYKGGKEKEEVDQVHDWLKERGWRMLSFAYACPAVKDMLDYFSKSFSGDFYYMIGGRSKTGANHAVICLNDKIIFDPSIEDSGIVGPMSDRFFYIDVFTPYNGLVKPIV